MVARWAALIGTPCGFVADWAPCPARVHQYGDFVIASP